MATIAAGCDHGGFSLKTLLIEHLTESGHDVLDLGLRTKDIFSKGMKEVSTSQMGDAIISKLK